MKQYKTNLSKNAFNHWTTSKAIAEFVSNFLDSEGERDFEFTDTSITLTNLDIKVSKSTLLLGMSDKQGVGAKRGQFGLGNKQAMVVLTSLGVSVVLYNHDVIWTPKFQFCESFEEDILIFEEEECTPTGSYSVVIEGLDESDVDEVRQRCLYFQEDREVLHSTSIGEIIETLEGDESEIFCGDMYVCQNEGFRYSYNFNPSVVPLTAERNAVDNFALMKLTAKLISMVEDDNFVKEAIEANSADTKLVVDRYYTDRRSYESTHAAVDLFGEEFVEENEATLVTSDYTEHQNNEKNNILSVFEANAVKAKSIQESQAYQDSIEDIETVEKLSPAEVIEKTIENLWEVLDNDICLEYNTKVKLMLLLDSLVEECDEGNWY